MGQFCCTPIADIQNALGRAAHEIHARPGRERAKKIVAQPLDERLEDWLRSTFDFWLYLSNEYIKLDLEYEVSVC